MSLRSPDSQPEWPLAARVRVRTYELDSFGHVNNAVYLNYLEEARSEFLKQMGVGLDFSDFERHGVHLVIVEAHLRYLRPARYGDTIVVRGRFRNVRATSAVIEYRLTDVDGNLFAEAETRGAFINATTGRPVRAPEVFRAAFASATELMDSHDSSATEKG